MIHALFSQVRPLELAGKSMPPGAKKAEPLDISMNNMENNSLNWLQDWYHSQCDGEWEHSYGIQIETLDNPGWIITIDLLETELEDCEFLEISAKRSDNDWINCLVKNGKFQGAGGSLNLLEILNVFKEWVESKISFEN
jgi:hypothetical protein